MKVSKIEDEKPRRRKPINGWALACQELALLFANGGDSRVMRIEANRMHILRYHGRRELVVDVASLTAEEEAAEYVEGLSR